MISRPADKILTPVSVGGIALRNRVAMAPMTRNFAPGGLPGPDNAAYYRRRAEGGVGLIITEGTWIDTPVSAFLPDAPNFFGDQAMAAWRLIVEEVHAGGSKIMPQLWHGGMIRVPGQSGASATPSHGPSGIDKSFCEVAPPMTQRDIDATIDAYARGAEAAQLIGFDGVELHAAHGYLIDQFFWDRTNRRVDKYGGSPRARTRFAVEIVQEIRRRVGENFPISLRFSQWKYGDYNVRIFNSVSDLAEFVEPLTDAGVDIFHASTRRFWDAAFDGSELGLAAWAKKLSGRASIAVGSVSLLNTYDPKATHQTETKNYSAVDHSLDRVAQYLDAGHFDIIALGRTLIANPEWVNLVAEDRLSELLPYSVELCSSL